jgi:hypothetical protein
MIPTQSGVSLRLKHHDQFQSGLASRTRLGFERFKAGTNGDLFLFCVFPVAEVEGFRSINQIGIKPNVCATIWSCWPALAARARKRIGG